MDSVVDKVSCKIDTLTQEFKESNDNLVGKLTKMKEKAEVMQVVLSEVRDTVNKLVVQKNNQTINLDAPPAKRPFIP